MRAEPRLRIFPAAARSALAPTDQPAQDDLALAASDSGVPGPAGFDVSLVAEVVESLDHLDTPQELDALVAKLGSAPQPQWRAVADRKVAAIHAVGQDG